MGMGLGLLPEMVVGREIRQRKFCALNWSGPSLDIDIHVIWHKDKWVSPAMTAFLELFKVAYDTVGQNNDICAAPQPKPKSSTSSKSSMQRKK